MRELNQVEVFADVGGWERDSVSIYFYRRQFNEGQLAKLEYGMMNLALVEQLQAPRPMFTINRDEAQAFMDSLWNVGIRPTAAEAPEGTLAAVQAHNADLRTIAFHALKIPQGASAK